MGTQRARPKDARERKVERARTVKLERTPEVSKGGSMRAATHTSGSPSTAEVACDWTYSNNNFCTAIQANLEFSIEKIPSSFRRRETSPLPSCTVHRS